MLTTNIQPAITAASLPLSDDVNIILDSTTSAEYEQTWRLNVLEWKGILTEEQFYDREIYLLTSSLTGTGNSTAWILTSPTLPSAPDGTRPILSACETLLKTAYVAREGKVDEITSHTIASVYTRPEYRGRGYAARMIAEVGKKLETWQQEPGSKGTVSVLYSDIGKKFYSRFGWKAFPSTHIMLAPLSSSIYTAIASEFPEVQDLHSSDLDDANSVSILLDNLKEVSSKKPSIPHVAFEPSTAQMRWHHMREEYQCKVLGKEEPLIKGAVHKPTGVALIWTRVYYPDPKDCHLNVLHVVIPQAVKGQPEAATDALAALLLRAQHEATKWDTLGGVELWDPSELVLAAAQKLRTEEQGKIQVYTRDKDHICSLKWNGRDDEEVVWVANEKYAWG